MTNKKGCSTRLAANQDVPLLKALWKTVFGDDMTDIDHFFNTYFSPELTVVIDDGTNLISAAYILPVGHLVLPDGKRFGCGMIYAIATLPEYRGHGYGATVTRAAGALACQKGFPAVVLRPADDKLFDFYTEHSDFRAFFEVFEIEYTAKALPQPDPRYTLLAISPTEYRQLRQSFLAGSTYIDMDERGLSFQLYLSAKSGGGLYALLYNGESVGCAVIEPEGDIVNMKELLLSGGHQISDAASAVAETLPALKYHVRSLSKTDELENGEYRWFGMMMPVAEKPDILSVQSAKWYGLAFD